MRPYMRRMRAIGTAPIRILKTLRRAAKIHDLHWSSRMQAHGVGSEACSLEQPGGRLRINELGVSLTRNRHEFLLKGLRTALLLSRRAKAEFNVNGDDQIVITIAGIRAIVESYQDLVILQEIYVAGAYNITTQRPAVVIDVGSNVGYASLFMAAQPNVLAVYGFEPFEPTFRQLQRNLSLNPELSKRIHVYNVGLGGCDTTLVLPYSYRKKGSMGVAPLKGGRRLADELTNLPITIVNAERLEEFTGPLDPAHALLLKIDCEGAEYEILPALQSAGILGHATAVMLEWHHRGPAALVSVLQQSTFTVLSTADPVDEHFGMIYAVRDGAAGHPPPPSS
jgi:FkbM family methyltransferase